MQVSACSIPVEPVQASKDSRMLTLYMHSHPKHLAMLYEMSKTISLGRVAKIDHIGECWIEGPLHRHVIFEC